MEHEHNPKHKGMMLLFVGAVVLVNEIFLHFSWWLVLGALLILKGLKMLFFCKKK
ncbi:MAG: hypothetical protein ABIJ34_02015 [archaeon]